MNPASSDNTRTPRGVVARVRQLLSAPAWSLVLALAAALAVPVSASATVLPPWGSNLSATPNYDTANGYYNSSTTAFNGNPAPGAGNAISPQYHSGDDLAVWNTGSAFTAPQGGQVLAVKVKGCAWRDTTVGPETGGNGTGPGGEQYSAGVNVRWLDFQALTRQPDGSYVQDGQTAAGFLMPFCSNPTSPASGAVNTSTVTTFNPVHLCINKGDTVDFYDIGGNIPNPAGPSWYPNGVPFYVIAGGARGQALDSFAHAQSSPSNFTGANLASEPNEELMLQVIEGVGDDAYGLCTGGLATEPMDSNTVICVARETSPGEPYGTCNGQSLPVFAPTNTSVPSISGAAGVGQRLNESHGAWTNSPYGYKLQWERCDLSGANCSLIAGATNGWYYPQSADLGDTLRVEEWAVNDANIEGPAVSTPTNIVAGGGGGGNVGGSGSSGGKVRVRLLRLNPASFFAARGTTVTYTDSLPARTALRVFRLGAGVLHGRRCVAPPRHSHGGVVKCTRVIAVKTLTHQDKSGGNGLKLGGLRPGRYELEVIASLGSARSFAIAPFAVKP